MSKQITIKYYSEFHVKEPYLASEDATGHDVFAAETKTFLPKSVGSISLEIIPSGFYGKLFPRSGILREHLVMVNAGMIDSDFLGKVAALLFNYHPEKTSMFVKMIELLRLFLWKHLQPIFRGPQINNYLA